MQLLNATFFVLDGQLYEWRLSSVWTEECNNLRLITYLLALPHRTVITLFTWSIIFLPIKT
jgi:hypothetical protein